MVDQFASYDIPDLAKMLRCSENHVRRLADRDAIPGRIRGVGRLIRFSRAVVDGWMLGQRAG